MTTPSHPLLSRRRTIAIFVGILLACGFVVWRQWPNHYRQQGETALAVREYDRARELFARYLSHRPGDVQARLLAARVARRLREYYEAQDHLRQCREGGGDAEGIAVETALIAIQRGEEPAPGMRQRAEQDDDLALVILEVLIQYDIDTYRLRQALQGLTRYLERRPDDLQALLARGHVWERFLYFADALEDYRRAVAAHPENPQARLKLAESLLIAETPQEALEHFTWLLQRRPERAEAKLGLARCHRLLGRPEEVVPLLTELLAQNPENGEALWERGQLEMDRGRPEDAETWLRQAVLSRPYDRRIAYSLHRCLLALDRPKEAAEVHARVARLDQDLRRMDRLRQEVMERPNDASLRCEAGLLFLANGEREEGLRWLQMALRLDPQFERARQALATAEKSAPLTP